MRLKTIATLCALSAIWANVTARDLKADLTALAPAGKTIRLAYVKGGPPQNFNQAENAALYAVSSDDGIIRKLYPAGTSVTSMDCVNMTEDGTRVVFYDRTRGETVIVNWETGVKVRSISSDRLVDYWINPADKTEWAVVTTGSSIQRININNPAAPVAVTTKAVPSNVHIDAGLCTGISDDGRKIIAVYEASGGGALYPAGPGLLDLATNVYTMGAEGCWPQMRSGTPIQLSQNNGIYRHRGPQIVNEDGTMGLWISSTSAMDSFFVRNPSLDASNTSCFPEEGHASDGHRWLRDRDYLTFTCQRSKINPILWHVPTRKWTYIEDTLSCIFAGDMEGVVGTFSATGADQRFQPRSGIARATAGTRTYSLDGRILAVPANGSGLQRGVVVSQLPNGAVRRVCR